MARKSSLGLGLAVAVATLALPAIAPASTSDYKGPITDDADGQVHFSVKKKHGKRTVLTGAGWKKLDVDCSGVGAAEVDTTFNITAKVNKHDKFDLDASRGNKNVYLRGTLDGSSASGVLRLDGPVDFGTGGSHHCESGEVGWTASKG